MRYLPIEVENAVSDFEAFTYCFDILLTTVQTLFLTSASKAIKVGETIFLPNSGLTMQECIFNDSAVNHIIFDGIFEIDGINKQMELTQAVVKILIYFPQCLYHFVTYHCNLYTKYDLGFRVRLVPETIKYNKSLLQSYSKTCRANFGDKKCKINKESYSRVYELAEITSKSVIIANIDQENGYYNNGDIIFGEGQFKAKIQSHFKDNIEIDTLIPESIKHFKNVTLITGCDKNFLTCCNKFNNAVNFRGEPLIPNHNFLKVSLR